MNFPADINQWDYRTIYTLVTRRDYEPGTYDFKEVLIGTGNEEGKKKLNDSICKAICAMANTDGGYLIFGVKDPKQWPNLTEQERMGGIPKSSEYVKEFGDKISSIHRKVHCNYPDRLIKLPHNDERGIFIVYIPLSPLRPHLFNGAFYKRADTGSTEPMDWHEVRDQMLYTEGRLQKVRLFRLKIAQIKEQNQILRNELGLYKTISVFFRFDTGAFETLLADICDLIPPKTGLLDKLLNITTTVNRINGILNRASLRSVQPQQSPDAYMERITQEYPQYLRNLATQLEECERQLTEIFDPLFDQF